MIFEELKDIKSARKDLRSFGLTMGLILAAIGAAAFYRGKAVYFAFILAGGLLASCGVTFYKLLRPLQRAWMALGVIIGFFMSRVILSALFYFCVTPIALVMKLFGRDILDERLEKEKASYWKDVEGYPKEKKSYENQY